MVYSMKKLGLNQKHIILVVILFFISMVYAVDMNKIITTVKFENKPSLILDDFYNGFGMIVQNHLRMNSNPGQSIVSGIYRDYLWRDTLNIKLFPFKVIPGKFIPMYTYTQPVDPSEPVTKDFNLVNLANTYYDSDVSDGVPDATGFPFIETRYLINDYYGGRLRELGGMGKTYSLYSENYESYPSLDTDGKHLKVWYFGVTLPTNFITDADHFIEHDLNSVVNPASDAKDIQYQLKVTRDPNENYTQEIIDKFGNVVSSWNNPNKPSDAGYLPEKSIVATFEYDLNNVTRVITPKVEAGANDYSFLETEFKYNTLGLMVKREDPDRGTNEFRYDKSGRLRFVKNAIHQFKDQQAPSGINHFMVHDYDAFSRLLQTCEYTGTHDFEDPDGLQPIDPTCIKSEPGKVKKLLNIYDKLEYEQLKSLNTNIDDIVLQKIVESLKNLKGQLAASIAFNISAQKTVEIFSYDEEKRISEKYKIIPYLPIQKISIKYDWQGNLESETYFSGYDTDWKQVSAKTYEYDSDISLKSIKTDGTENVRYDYNDIGLLSKKIFYDNGTELEAVSYQYSINDLSKNIQTVNDPALFQEHLYYAEESPGTGFNPGYIKQFNGNISNILLKGTMPGASSYEHKLSYNYDGLNRLRNVSQGIADNNSDPFDEGFIYDNLGRFKKKTEGTNILDNYTYTMNTNQLAYLLGHPTKGRKSAGSLDCNDGSQVTSDISDDAEMTVFGVNPVILKQPYPHEYPWFRLAKVGYRTVCAIKVRGKSLTYQWQKKSKHMGGDYIDIGENSPILSFIMESDLLLIRCIITNSITGVSVTTNELVEIDGTKGHPFSFALNPENQTVYENTDAAFEVIPNVDPNELVVTYQWQKKDGVNWVDISSANNSTYTITNVTYANNGEIFRCVSTVDYTDQIVEAISEEATLTVIENVGTFITWQPRDEEIYYGETATFSVTASGQDLEYQWQENEGDDWINIPNATNTNYTTEIASINDNGNKYRCIVSNDGSCRDNYLYDPNGNMVLDRSKNMVIEYNWRDMPTKFKFYSDIPLDDPSGDPLQWSDLSSLSISALISEVQMMYDSQGNRVQKLSFHNK